MYIFEFHLTERNLENAHIDGLLVAARYYRCTVELQRILKDIAVSGESVVNQEGVRKGAEIIEALSSAPFVVSNDFDIICEPLYSEIRTVNNQIIVKGSKARFFDILRELNGKHDLPEVTFKNQSTCRFFYYWISQGRPSEIKLLYKELREVLDLKKANYKAYVHYQRVLSTVKSELEKAGVSIEFEKYPKDEARASGVLVQING